MKLFMIKFNARNNIYAMVFYFRKWITFTDRNLWINSWPWAYETIWLRKKWSFPLRISSVNVNVTKSAGNWGFGHIYWENPQWKTLFFVQCVNGISQPINTLKLLKMYSFYFASLINPRKKSFFSKFHFIKGMPWFCIQQKIYLANDFLS